jgi:hypothetical protein
MEEKMAKISAGKVSVSISLDWKIQISRARNDLQADSSVRRFTNSYDGVCGFGS